MRPGRSPTAGGGEVTRAAPGGSPDPGIERLGQEVSTGCVRGGSGALLAFRSGIRRSSTAYTRRLTGKNKDSCKEGRIRVRRGGEGRIHGMAVKKDMLDLGDIHTSLIDGVYMILGKHGSVSFHLFSTSTPEAPIPAAYSYKEKILMVAYRHL